MQEYESRRVDKMISHFPVNILFVSIIIFISSHSDQAFIYWKDKGLTATIDLYTNNHFASYMELKGTLSLPLAHFFFCQMHVVLKFVLLFSNTTVIRSGRQILVIYYFVYCYLSFLFTWDVCVCKLVRGYFFFWNDKN